MSELYSTDQTHIVDAELVPSSSVELFVDEGTIVSNIRTDRARKFFDEIADDPELVRAAMGGIANLLANSRKPEIAAAPRPTVAAHSSSVAVRRPSSVGVRTMSEAERNCPIVRPPLVLPGNRLKRPLEKNILIITPLMLLAKDVETALVRGADKIEDWNDRLGEVDLGPMYQAGINKTKYVTGKAVEMTKPVVVQATRAAKSKFDALPEDRRRRLTAAAIAGLVCTGVVTGTITADVHSRTPERAGTSHVSDTNHISVQPPITGQTLLTREQLLTTGDQNNG